MNNGTKPRKQARPNADDVATELRLLTREAHEAMRGLRDLIREIDRLTGPGDSNAADLLVEKAVNAKMLEVDKFLKAESDKVARQMVDEVQRARDWIMNHLELIRITESPGGLIAEFRSEE